MFEHVDYYAGDPILSLVEVYKNDNRPNKVNLSIGVYYDDKGVLPVLNSVRKAEELFYNQHVSHGYIPMEGLAEYRQAAQRLLFGEKSIALNEERVATIQTLGGSGALRVAGEFLKKYFPKSKVYASDPTWGNHIAIFEASGFEVEKYPYYDNETGSVKFDEMIEFISKREKLSIILLHPCCHNPTGVDLNQHQWDQVLNLIKEKELIAFMDIAYQGFGDSVEEDAYPIRKAVSIGLSFIVSNSYSKNLSLYGERVGGLSIVTPNKKEAELVFSQLTSTVRRIYSSPPSTYAHVVSILMNTPALYEEWLDEVNEMRDRIKEMRQKIFEVLKEKIPNKDFSRFIKQRGMFTFTGLTKDQVLRLRDEFAIYLVGNGRMCVAGLNTSNIDYIAQSFAVVLQD